MDEENSIELHDEVVEGQSHDMKNAEDQSVASVDKAADGTSQAPARKGDKKNSDPMPKTKGAMINAMYSKLSGMKKQDLAASYSSVMGEDVDFSDEEVFAEESADYSEELTALVESEATLSEEFKVKTAVIFEAALKSKLAEEVERIETAYEDKLAEETASQNSELVEKVDSYLNYVVENWMAENEVAIQNGLRAEIAENFMENLKGLFVESYIEVPDSKVDLVDDLADQVEELEEALNRTTEDAIALSEHVEVLTRDAIVSEAISDLADTQAEKFEKLVESVDFEDAETFASKVATVKESFFAKSVEVTEEVTTEEDAVALTEDVAPSMSKYLNAIRKTSQQ
tara:strand:+ start:8170 stop:9198 length:1029 start_codon:yes stop_codon:yes gene_type:complete